MDGLQTEEVTNESILLPKTLQEKLFLNYFNVVYFLNHVFRSTQTSLLLLFLMQPPKDGRRRSVVIATSLQKSLFHLHIYTSAPSEKSRLTVVPDRGGLSSINIRVCTDQAEVKVHQGVHVVSASVRSPSKVKTFTSISSVSRPADPEDPRDHAGLTPQVCRPASLLNLVGRWSTG